jgi:hypothetical protein
LLCIVFSIGHGRDHMVHVVGFNLPVQSVPIATNVRSNPNKSEVYSIQHYVIKFVSDLGQVDGLLRFPPPIKLTHDITKILLKVAFSTIKPNHTKPSIDQIEQEKNGINT